MRSCRRIESVIPLSESPETPYIRSTPARASVSTSWPATVLVAMARLPPSGSPGAPFEASARSADEGQCTFPKEHARRRTPATDIAPPRSASGTGRGEPARGRLLLFQIQHGRPSVDAILRHSVECAAGVNEADLRSRRVLQDDAIPPDSDGARALGPISPFERID